eukprot:SAG22_NODE_877_length_6715_cov_28.285369_2_plen_178_part_00
MFAMLAAAAASLPLAAGSFSLDAKPLADSVPDGGYGGLGYARGFGAGYTRDADSPAAAVEALMVRIGLTPGDFVVSAIPKDAKGLDTMQLGSSADGKVLVKGSSGVAMASALNWYLNEFVNTTYDWNTYHLALPPGPLPLPPSAGTAVRARTVPWGYCKRRCLLDLCVLLLVLMVRC